MSGDDVAVFVDEQGTGPAEAPNAADDLLNLLFGMGASVTFDFLEASYRDEFNFELAKGLVRSVFGHNSVRRFIRPRGH